MSLLYFGRNPNSPGNDEITLQSIAVDAQVVTLSPSVSITYPLSLCMSRSAIVHVDADDIKNICSSYVPIVEHQGWSWALQASFSNSGSKNYTNFVTDSSRGNVDYNESSAPVAVLWESVLLFEKWLIARGDRQSLSSLLTAIESLRYD